MCLLALCLCALFARCEKEQLMHDPSTFASIAQDNPVSPDNPDEPDEPELPQRPDGDGICGTVTDYDGNTYQTVRLGSQVWMAENLRTKHYANGVSIALGSTNSETVAYRYFPDGNSNYASTYGYLYNWPAVMHNSSSSSSNPSHVQGICPTGWHVPSKAEWAQLVSYVSGVNYYLQMSGTAAKALASTTGWNTSTTPGAVGSVPSINNSTDFNAKAAGKFWIDWYLPVGAVATYWTSTADQTTSTPIAYIYGLGNNSAAVSNSSTNVYGGFSVRCVKN